jgi:prophage antirepressor-like protein
MNANEYNISEFHNIEFGTVRVISENGKWLFCGADVAFALGYSKTRNAVGYHCKAPVKRDILTNGGVQSMTFIPEGDVYRLIVKSNLPKAENFERWIFDEIMPTIRKTGGYMTESLLAKAKEDPDVLLQFAQQLVMEHSKNEKLTNEVTALLPKAEYYDRFINPANCTNIRTTAKEMKISERRFCRCLIDSGFLYRSPSGTLLPYATKKNEELFIVRDFIKNGHFGSQTLITPKGKELFAKLFKEPEGD